MKKLLRLAVLIMCITWLFSLLGCSKGGPFVVDGPGMERKVWSAFTIARCDERFEPIYSYTVTYDMDRDEAYLHEGQDEENCVLLRQDTVTELMNLNLLSLPDEGPVTGNFLVLTVFDTKDQAYPKRISKPLEEEILALLESYLVQLKEEPTMLDGPGMVYQSPWTSFSISRTDSNTQYSFWFEVTETDDGAVVTGECQDENGMRYETEVGIPSSVEDLWALRWMDFDQLPEEEPWPEDLERPTDTANITLTFTLRDGTVEEKSASSDLSIKIYELLLPYLKNN